MKFQKHTLLLRFLILAILGLGSNAFAQNQVLSNEATSEMCNIYFGEKLPREIVKGMPKNNFTIQISDDNGNLVENLNANEFAEYSLTKPGKYTIHVQSIHAANPDDNQCNHDLHDKDVQVNVLPYRIVMDFNAIQFSKDLEGGIDMANSSLIVPVEYTSITNESMKLSGFSLVGAGINNTIVGSLFEKEVTLKPGINLLTFQLSGSVQKGTYVMFDFLDPSGRTNCYYYPNQIK